MEMLHIGWNKIMKKKKHEMNRMDNFSCDEFHGFHVLKKKDGVPLHSMEMLYMNGTYTSARTVKLNLLII
jgi:hypothetical protein